ncbi:hypothetical protein niasHT_037771 [Heterodera trifolii]|uniref:Uncharacterized protein n=1 Tax=Heterodera trifolii TaxID=157864 RepID=A0ABD2J7T0_9BILA
MVVHQSLSVTPTLSADGTVLVPLDQQQTQRHLAFHYHRHFSPTSPSSAMAPSSSSAAAMTPLGVILVFKDESAERVLFMYPFERRTPPTLTSGKSAMSTRTQWQNCSLKFYCFPVDNLRFVGFPWHITGCVHSLAVVFILRGFADRHIVDAFQRLSKKIAIATNTEQQRCNYLRDQISLAFARAFFPPLASPSFSFTEF